MKIDITYLKRLVIELETELRATETITDTTLTPEARIALEQTRLIALNKATGICMGIYQESTMLTYDIQKAVAATFTSPPPAKGDVAENTLSSFLKTFKVREDKN